VKSLESVIRHETRLEVLGNLTYGGPCRLQELSQRVGLGAAEVGYHLAVLRSQRLVAKQNDQHVATLDDQPAWVEEAVTAYQLAKRVSLKLPSSAMLGLKCDHCNRLLRYRQRAIAIWDDGGTLRAKLVTEGTPGSSEADELGAMSKYHTDCYEKARQSNVPLPPLESEL
jgi:DNA-binding transcriptional ArsR family regulator